MSELVVPKSIPTACNMGLFLDGRSVSRIAWISQQGEENGDGHSQHPGGDNAREDDRHAGSGKQVLFDQSPALGGIEGCGE
jgi:hypothetical protein